MVMGARRRPEDAVHLAVLAWLRSVLPREAVETLIHVPNGEARHPITGARLKRLGVRPGVEDLQFVWRGRLHAIEVKPARGRQSASQRERQAALEAAGARYAVVRSIEDARAALREWGVCTREVIG